jgi:signal transduction histidine kinase
VKTPSRSTQIHPLTYWLRKGTPPYRDVRFWLIQVLNLLSCVQLLSLPSAGNDVQALTKTLQTSLVLQSFVLFFLIAVLSSGIIFGLKGAISTIVLTSLFLVPKLIQWSPSPYGEVILARTSVIGLLSIAMAYLVSRERTARKNIQILNEKMKEFIREKDRFFKLASEAQENERRRISRDLHDDSLQLLATVLLQLDGAINAEDADKSKTQMLRAKETITQTTDAIRRYCEALRPLQLDTLGLVASVESIGQDLERTSGIKVNFDTEGESRLIRDDDKIHVFRVMQEAFHNIEKHSKATAVRVRWKYSDEGLEISVTDNGIGMWNFGPSPARSLGIQGMYERMELTGGKLNIESQPGFGTRVSLKIPFEKSLETH